MSTTPSSDAAASAVFLAISRPLVVIQDLRAGYAAMAADEAREAEADAWTEGLNAGIADEPLRHGG